MVGTALFEVCAGIVTGLTQGVAEHFINTNEESLCLSESPLVYNPLESTGLEWNHRPVDECIYEEYKDREVTISRHFTWRKVQPKVLNALLPDDGEVTTEQTNDKRTTWKLFRPSLKGTLRKSLCFGFLISFLSAFIIGSICILVYYINYQTVLVCLTRHNQTAVPIKIQWSKTISEVMIVAITYFWFTLSTLFYFRPYQIEGIKRSLFLISFQFYVLNSVLQLIMQWCGIYISVWTQLLKIPNNAFLTFCVCVQTWIIAQHFSTGNRIKKTNISILLVACSALPLVVGLLVANLVYPAYNQQGQTGKILIATFTPLIFAIFKLISRFAVQRLWRISHPGRTFVYLAPLYYGSAVMARVLQVDLKDVKTVALIGIIHGLAEVIERSTVILIDYLYRKIAQRKRVTWQSFRTPRRERLATDIAIMSMLYEASAIMSVNGFIHLHEYFYTDNETCQIIQSLVITTAVPLTIEWFFSGMSIAIETHYQNRPIFAEWRKQWKRHLVVAMINALPITVWSSTSLLIVIEKRFVDLKDYCELPFSHL